MDEALVALQQLTHVSQECRERAATLLSKLPQEDMGISTDLGDVLICWFDRPGLFCSVFAAAHSDGTQYMLSRGMVDRRGGSHIFLAKTLEEALEWFNSALR